MSLSTIQVIKTRRSIRSFLDKPVDEEIIREVIDCGRLAATALNVQPWEFVVVRDQAMRERLSRVCDYGKFLSQSPVCIAVFCRETKYYLEDGSAAIENILLAAWANGVGTCWIAGDKKSYAPEIAQTLSAPKDCRLIGLVAMGYPKEAAKMPTKRPLDEVLHWEKF